MQKTVQHPHLTNRARPRPKLSDSQLYIPARQPQSPRPRQILSASQRMRAVHMQPQRGYIPMPPPPAMHPPNLVGAHSRAPRHRKKTNTLLFAILGIFVLAGASCIALTVGAMVILNKGTLPGVNVAGINVGGMTTEEVESALLTRWQTVTLRDGDRVWQIDRESLGIRLDAAATSQRAYDTGRANLPNALFGTVEVAPVVSVNPEQMALTLAGMIDQINIEPVNAGVTLINGQVQATLPQDGRALDVDATVKRTVENSAAALANGEIELVMQPIAPAVTDATPMVEAASRLLANPLSVRVYDPVTGDMVYWIRQPGEWASWITAVPDANSPIGMALTVSDRAVRDFLAAQASIFDSSRYLKVDEAAAAIQNAVAAGKTETTIRVYHHDRQHVVQAGETIVSIAWDYGVPYLYIQQANPGVENLSVGQMITIPSPDSFLLYPPVPEKRIVVSISEQRTWVYENGQIKWEWASSTGITDSPTWPGIYQIISHEENAYAGNWNLWMPYFMGVYQPIPGSEFTNGFHGFPTRGGGQLLWENSLGRRVTYGCILISTINAQLLYNWAEEGVVVEIRA